jgi:hypothetical protein
LLAGEEGDAEMKDKEGDTGAGTHSQKCLLSLNIKYSGADFLEFSGERI